ncbi:MAG: glycine--tRNA ligase subunit beta [Pseudomonadota bacterium]
MTDVNAVADCLIEIGMEELPPKAMPALSSAFHDNMVAGLQASGLAHNGVARFAAPRRLALRIDALAMGQSDEALVLRGPPIAVAFDADGNPTRAAEAFAKKNGVSVEALTREVTDKGEWLQHKTVKTGLPTAEVIGDIINKALADLPIPKRMRWGDSTAAFVRPVHWVVVLHNGDVVPCNVLGVAANRNSRGHRFHANEWFEIQDAASYEAALEQRYVIADFDRRKQRVSDAVASAAKDAGGHVVPDDALLTEITALCDWPVAVTGSFDARFLRLPQEVLTSTLKVHQRYFPLEQADGSPMAAFITVANIESREPDEVRRGNERVIAPRLADAEFFWHNDLKTPLADRAVRLQNIVYQKALGSVGDKVARSGAVAVAICEALGVDAHPVSQAMQLSRCDLVTDMVGEFPELQGIMGAYYAARSGLSEDVVTAIRSQYQPAFAGDDIPATLTGQIVSAADRIDTLAGIFAIGKKPTGNRDPFGLRRAALGLVRILIEADLAIDLRPLVNLAGELQPVQIDNLAGPTADTDAAFSDAVMAFISDRTRGYYRQNAKTEKADLFDAVAARAPATLIDFDQRMHAVASFVERPEAEALAAANKRIGNLLRSALEDTTVATTVAPALIQDPSEQALFDAANQARSDIAPMLQENRYSDVLARLADLRESVDAFFDNVMVMDDDLDIRGNRLALLTDVRAMFLEVADISELAGTSG